MEKENYNKNQKIDVAFLLRLKSFNKKIFKEKDLYIYSFITEHKINKHKIIDVTLFHGNHLVYAENAGLVVFKMKGYSMQDKSGTYFTDINEIMKNIEKNYIKEYSSRIDLIERANKEKEELAKNFESIKNYFITFDDDKKNLQKMFVELRQNFVINKIEKN